MNTSNIILTGLPRSGSTLTCHLLNKVKNTIALNEPMDMGFSNDIDKSLICKEIRAFFLSTRQSALHDKNVLTIHINGKIPDNPFGDHKNDNGLRINRNIQKSLINIDKDLSEDFTLCIKHNGIFTALLHDLAAEYPCYGIIRNPLSVLASWNSVNAPIYDGHMPVAEKIDLALHQSLKNIPDRIDRQLHILSWFFSHYNALPSENIIRYEDMILSGGSSLSRVNLGAGHLSEPLVSKNLNELYDKQMMRLLGEKLLNTAGDFWRYYETKDVQQILSEIRL